MMGLGKPKVVAQPAAQPAAAVPADPLEVRVRMYRALETLAPQDERQRAYRGLLGDCFLIRLTRGDSHSNILIDCGMLLGSPDATARMQAIVADIVSACGGDLGANRAGVLDLLVVTHEHWDHISGFSQAVDVFFDAAKLHIANLWMAWTEDPDDPKSAELRKRFDKSGAAFAALAQRLDENSQRFGADASSVALSGLEGFLGVQGAGGKLAGRDIMKRLKELGDPAADPRTTVKFQTPGDVTTTPGAIGLTTYVLGPPKNFDRLFKDSPSSGAAQETYLDGPNIDGAQIQRFAAGEEPNPATDSPFARPYCRIPAKELESSLANGAPPAGDAREWLRTHYYGVPDTDKALDAANARRRIDTDWLGAAGPLALKLDNDTNNTSLVLAFELPDADKSILLFAADAQVGNWLSWHDQDYVDSDGTKQTAEQLLNRTRFYKVGHHGSHNATLHDRGLAMMIRDDLVAAIPTDEDLGKQQGRSGWLMPNPRVKAALVERTKGRIMRNDRRYDAASVAVDPELKSVEKDFFQKIEESDLYLEYRIQ